MSGSKKWYLSKTLWGGIIILASTILSYFGYSVSETDAETFVDALLSSIETVANLVGIILVIYGRIKATKVMKI